MFTSFCVLCSVIVISQLIRLSDVLVTFGLTLENILMPFLFILLPFLSFTIPMAFMFAVLITFSRVSADGEFNGMLAAGYSLRKAAVPMMLLSGILYLLTTLSSLYLEPWGTRARKAFYREKAQTQLDNIIKIKMKSGVFVEDFLGYVLYAEFISQDRSRFENVLLTPGPQNKQQKFTLLAPRATLSGSVETGDLKMLFIDGMLYQPESSGSTSMVRFGELKMDLLRLFAEQIYDSSAKEEDYRGLNPHALSDYVENLRGQDDEGSQRQFYKSAYLFHQRFGMPFALIFFCMFAMVLGIQDERRGKSYGYIGSILVIISSYVVMMTFKYWSENGLLPAFYAVWIPNMILLSLGVFVMYQKNRLPPSESIFDPRHMPLLSRLRPPR